MILQPFFVSLLLFGSSLAVSEEISGIRAGPNMAVQEANLKEGFRLSNKAKQVIDVVTRPLGTNPHKIPSSALVFYGDRIGVYRLRNGWFKLVEIQKNTTTNFSSVTASLELKDDDQIAVEGVALLRVSEMDAFGGEQ